MACEHNIPETAKGAGPCRIAFEVKKRNGKPNWWCRTHGMDASAPDGAALPACPGAWFDPVPPERQITLDITHGELAVWGAVPPAILIGAIEPDAGHVHVHHRSGPAADKDIDSSFDIVRLRNGDRELVVETMAAVAFSTSELAGQQVVALRCPKAACGQVHIDELKFATFPHSKHLCNSCGRNFRWTGGASISNPLADAYSILRVERPPTPTRANSALTLRRSECSAIALWPSNAAILSTMTRPEEIGIHVHAWNHDGDQVLDETYASVSLDGESLDEGLLRLLSVQRALAHGAPVIAMACGACGDSMTSPAGGWAEPKTVHSCRSCGAVTKTRRRVFVNPLADK